MLKQFEESTVTIASSSSHRAAAGRVHIDVACAGAQF